MSLRQDRPHGTGALLQRTRHQADRQTRDCEKGLPLSAMFHWGQIGLLHLELEVKNWFDDRE